MKYSDCVGGIVSISSDAYKWEPIGIAKEIMVEKYVCDPTNTITIKAFTDSDIDWKKRFSDAINKQKQSASYIGTHGSYWIIDESISKFHIKNPLDIEKIMVNTKKKATTVKFGDGKFITVKLSDGDSSDLFDAVAAAFCIKKYRSNSAFKKKLRDEFGNDSNLTYLYVARIRWIDYVGSIKKCNEIIKEKTVLMPGKGAKHGKKRTETTKK